MEMQPVARCSEVLRDAASSCLEGVSFNVWRDSLMPGEFCLSLMYNKQQKGRRGRKDEGGKGPSGERAEGRRKGATSLVRFARRTMRAASSTRRLLASGRARRESRAAMPDNAGRTDGPAQIKEAAADDNSDGEWIADDLEDQEEDGRV